jgi:hypothetical protein
MCLVDFVGARIGGRFACVPGVLAVVGLSLVLAPVAFASSPSFTWTGGSAEAKWSAAKNWEGEVAPEVAPSDLEPVSLDFPRLASCTGTTCYTSINDLSGLNVKSVSIDDGDDYELEGEGEGEGEGITLGSGGLMAAPAVGSSGLAGAFLDLPISLSAEQTWSIAGRNDGALGENGIALEDGLSGSASPLTLSISNEALAVLASNTEVGPVSIEGANASKAGILNGFVELLGEDLNSTDEHPVSLRHIFFIGSGALGPLSTDEAELVVEEHIKTASATFDAASHVGFEIYTEGTTAGTDYSQLASTGTVELGGSSLLVHVAQPPKKKASEPEPPCPSLVPGQTYTFVSTTGTLSGSFAKTLESEPEISVEFAETCSQRSQKMRIEYNRTGTTHTVTGIVEAAAKEKQEEESKKEEALRNPPKVFESPQPTPITGDVEATSREATARAEAARKAQEEAAAAAAATKHREEEADTKQEEGKSESKPPTRAQLLSKALKQCEKQSKKKRAKCEATAKKKYGPKRKAKNK